MAALQCEICGGKLIGKPGGLFECEYCGVQYDTAWAKEKIQEIKGTVKVEGTVEVTGSVKVDGAVEVKGSVSKESLLRRGQLALEDKDWKTAEEYFEKVLDIAPECADAYFGLAICSARVNDLEALVNANQWENKYYLKGKRFATAAQLYQVEQLEQTYTRRVREEAERTRIAREKLEKEEHIAREENARKLKPIRDRILKAACLIDAGPRHTVGVCADGRVIAVGANAKGQCDVGDWRDIVAVAAGNDYTVGLKTDGTVVAVGNNEGGQCNVSDWQDIVSVSVEYWFTVGLKADGTVVAAGKGLRDLSGVSEWRDIVAVSAGTDHVVGLKSDGRVVSTKSEDQECVSNWRDIVAVRAEWSSTVGLTADGRVLTTNDNKIKNVGTWRDIVSIGVSKFGIVGMTADGKVVGGLRTSEIRDWQNIVAVGASERHTVGLTANGTVIAEGSNYSGQCNVSDWKLFRQLDNLEQERIDARTALQKQEKEEYLAQLKQEEERRQKEEQKCKWRRAVLCQHCGGAFKGLFGKKCSSCGKPKDY